MSDVKLDRMAEIGMRQQTAGGVMRQVSVLRLHFLMPGEDKTLCGKSRGDLKKPPAENMRDLCRDCARKAREQKIPFG
jgi:hypothetical protein